jgi:hypothetical protein
MDKMMKLLLFLCMLLLQVSNAMARIQNDEIINAWLEAGSLKFFPTKKESGVGIDATLKFQINRMLANLQYHDYTDRELAHGGFELFTENNHYHAGNVMIGITNKKCRHGHVSISSGLGIFWGRFDENTVEKFKTLGWPVEAAASLNIFPFMGINLKVFTNINSKHSLIGFGMDLQLGKLRNFNLNEIF